MGFGGFRISRTAKVPKRRGRGILAVIGALLVASAAVRGVGTAVALENAEPAVESAVETAMASHDAPSHEADSDVPSCAAESDIEPILAALKTREERIAKREREIDMRMQALNLAESQIDAKMEQMRTVEARLRATLSIAQTAAEDDVERLTQVYANMKPKQAAALFSEMDPEFAAGFLARMRPDSAAAIMAGLDPQKAYTISVMLAGRNANAPKE